jgi:hypothetical protein
VARYGTIKKKEEIVMRISLIDIIREKSEFDKGTLDRYKKILNAKDLASFVSLLKVNINDPKIKALLKSGLLDGDLTDDQIKTSSTTVVCSQMTPTQKEIDVEKSLGWFLAGKSSAKQVLSGGSVITLGSKILTANQKYVIDGHHRWSQPYCFNPETKMAALDMTGANDPVKFLKAVQAAIAFELGDIPVKTVKGHNLMTISESSLIKYVQKTAVDQVVLDVFSSQLGQTFANKNKLDYNEVLQAPSDLESKKWLGKFIFSNVQIMRKKSKPISKATSRGVMPQADQAPNALNNLATGEVNYEIPVYEYLLAKSIQILEKYK